MKATKPTLYFLQIAIISGSLQSSPSMLYMPSTMTIIFFQGLRVLGCPSAICSLKTSSKWEGAVNKATSRDMSRQPPA